MKEWKRREKRGGWERLGWSAHAGTTIVFIDFKIENKKGKTNGNESGRRNREAKGSAKRTQGCFAAAWCLRGQ